MCKTHTPRGSQSDGERDDRIMLYTLKWGKRPHNLSCSFVEQQACVCAHGCASVFRHALSVGEAHCPRRLSEARGFQGHCF